MSARSILVTLSVGRLLLAVVMVLAPRSIGKRWLGEGATSPEARAYLQTTGIRDAGYAIGCLHAVRTGADLGPWFAAGLAFDGVDAYATLSAEEVPAKIRLGGSIGALIAIAGNVAGLATERRRPGPAAEERAVGE